MAGTLMLVNPRRKRSRRRMTALQRKYFGKRRSRSSRGRRRASTIVVANPRRRRRRSSHRRRSYSRRRSTVVVARNPRRRHHRRRRYSFRRNPVDQYGTSLSSGLVCGAIGAAGAFGVSWLMGNIPLPPQIQQGTIAYPIVKVGAAVLLGMAAGAVTNKAIGRDVTAGAIALTVYQFAVNQLQQSGSQVQLGRVRRFGRYVRMRGIGKYIRMRGMGAGPNVVRVGRRKLRGLGYMNPARLVAIRRRNSMVAWGG